ncbi:Auxin response factor 6 [Platanthera guangdongensis]|uniref:Auxin response factor 6 n=1 Tax=Platanthera guangdongensis TaxID=2320717 RepID=A0ABR2LWK0_9ASPA
MKTANAPDTHDPRECRKLDCNPTNGRTRFVRIFNVNLRRSTATTGEKNSSDRQSVDWDKAWSSFRKRGKNSLFSRLKLDKYVRWNPWRSEYPMSEETDPIKRAERSNLELWTSPGFTLVGAILVICMNSQLWHACAGIAIHVLMVDSLFYYSHWGHAEHAQSSVHFNTFIEIPPLILCRVSFVKFIVDSDNDDIFANISMIPIILDELNEIEGDDEVSFVSKNPKLRYFKPDKCYESGIFCCTVNPRNRDCRISDSNFMRDLEKHRWEDVFFLLSTYTFIFSALYLFPRRPPPPLQASSSLPASVYGILPKTLGPTRRELVPRLFGPGRGANVLAQRKRELFGIEALFGRERFRAVRAWRSRPTVSLL